MLFKFNMSILPNIAKVYSVTRKTVWQIAEPHNLLIIITDGQCSIDTDNVEYHLKKGDILFVPANQTYTRCPIGDALCTMTYIHFKLNENIESMSSKEAAKHINEINDRYSNAIINEEALNNDDFNECYLFTHNYLGQRADVVNELIDKAYKTRLRTSMENRMLLSLYISEILVEISKNTVESLKEKIQYTEAVPSRLRKAIIYIHQNVSKKITLDDLCQFCNISKPQMIRYFKSGFNTTPMKYICRFKLNRAKEMMMNMHHMSIREISDELGFEDANYFSRIFTKENGETPSEYRYRVCNFGRLNKEKAPGQ